MNIERTPEEHANGSSHLNDAVWHRLPHECIDGTLAAIIDAKKNDPQSIGVQMLVPSALGQGSWRILTIQTGMSIMLADLGYQESRRIEVPGEHLIKIRIMLSGSLQAEYSGITINGAGAYLEYYPVDLSSSYCLAGGVPIRMVVISVSPATLIQTLGLTELALPQELRPLTGSHAGSPKSLNIRLGPELTRAAYEMLYSLSIVSPRLVRPYLQARATEILSLVVTQLDRTQDRENLNLRVTPRDVDRVYQARGLLYECYREPMTISMLARAVGINQTKLKALFRAMFDMTIGEFIQKRRMEIAVDLLHDFDLSIAQVAYKVGYNHPANFSAVFKRFHGHLPRETRQAGGYLQFVPGDNAKS
jgi:AraC family transcriptional regulator, transcriptional activator of the genes for pyochelin and ferripyochelin receptors